MVKSGDILRDKSLHRLAGRHFGLFVILISMMLDGAASFSCIKTYEIHVDACIIVSLWRDFFL